MANFYLSDLAEVVQGNILTRIKPTSQFDETEEIEAISMQELSYYVGDSDSQNEIVKIKVQKGKSNSFIYTQQKDIVVGLSSRKAMVVEEERSTRLLLSNFVRVRISDFSKLDPYYFCWLFNENLQFRNENSKYSQGSANVSVLSINELKKTNLELPNINTQRIIGQVYNLGRRKDRISKIILEKEKTVRNVVLIKNSKEK